MPTASGHGTIIHYDVEGEGEPLLLHPGFIGSGHDWVDAGYVAALRHRYRVVMLDPRGQGRSATPRAPEAYTVAHRVADALAVLDAEGIERAHVWGYSMGGGLGLALGLRAPERVRSLVLGAGDPFLNADPVAPDWMLERLRCGMARLVEEMETAMPDPWLSPGERARWLASDPEALAAARTQRLREPWCEEAALPAIRLPTLLYAGTGDSAAAAVERIARRLPRARLVMLDGLDHAQALARSDLVLPRVVAFLASVSREQGGGQADRPPRP